MGGRAGEASVTGHFSRLSWAGQVTGASASWQGAWALLGNVHLLGGCAAWPCAARVRGPCSGSRFPGKAQAGL